MVDAGLYALYKLHLVDSALIELQHRAAALDTGKRDAAEAKAIDEQTASQRSETRKAMTELKVLEDEHRAVEDKARAFEKKMYDGSVTSSREIENLQKEILMLAQQNEVRQNKIEAKRAVLPTMQEEALATEKLIGEKTAAAAKKREAAKAEYAHIQARFEVVKANRADVVDDVPSDLARHYDAARHKTGGTGMAAVTEKSTCGHCGVHVPEKSCEMIRVGRVTHCEQCGRILFIVQPSA